MIIPQGTGKLVKLVALNVYVNDSPLSVINLEKLLTFYLNWPVWMIIP